MSTGEDKHGNTVFNDIMRLTCALLCAVICAVSQAEEDLASNVEEYHGYVTVHDRANMFWVLYPTELPGDWKQHPLILWLQGGPGASGVGYGNFMELGPTDIHGNKREGAWTKKANILFADNPVGTGFSYVESLDAFTTTNQEIADDLLELVKSVFAEIPDLQEMPFFVYAESYGGKMTVDFALTLDAAIKKGEVKSNFQGVCLGDSWISPMDSVDMWGSYLYSMGFVNKNGRQAIEASAAKVQAEITAENWLEATTAWSDAEIEVLRQTENINFYNVLAKDDVYRKYKSHSHDLTYMSPPVRQLYQMHVRDIMADLDDFMNGVMANQWNIPQHVVWGAQEGRVFDTLAGDFMKPVVASVVRLLTETDLHVAVYTGNLDLICDTPGTFRWIEEMEWPDKAKWEAATNTPVFTSFIYPEAYVQRYGQFSVFSVLRAGHMVPLDAPDFSLQMIDMISQFASEKEQSSAVETNETAQPISNEVAVDDGETRNAKGPRPKHYQAKPVKSAQKIAASHPHPATPTGRRLRVARRRTSVRK
ncbi:retinoid-inducible serine carboxypeptidase-like [Oratosquilla oratoria]|uniref:retinoid-inducible serine carboxypeptidase-like n=1 Tax=Oratosquilla oratoria TaxID=337810 RepID=UPI003F761D96